MVGEKVYVTVPLENCFNTPLQLRRVHLLWRFTTDQGDTFTNDKQAGPGGGVEVGVLEAVSVEANALKPVVLEVWSTRVGVLSLLGLEYSVKAVFPDKEPTDHEIRGKQYFQAGANKPKEHSTKSLLIAP